MSDSILLSDKNSYLCCLHDTPRTFDWCEENCVRYYRCDTVAWAGDDISEIEGHVSNRHMPKFFDCEVQ